MWSRLFRLIRSFSVTMPKSEPASSTTGTPLISFSTRRVASSSMEVSGLTVTTFLVMMSLAVSIMSPPYFFFKINFHPSILFQNIAYCIRNLLDQITGDHALLAFILRSQVSGKAVKIDTETCCLRCSISLRQKTADHPGKHVTRTACSHARVARGVNENPSIRRRDHCASTLEHDNYFIFESKVRCDANPVLLHISG